MKVFTSKTDTGYSGGMVLVAANTAEEALRIAAEKSKYSYLYSHYDYDTGWFDLYPEYMTDFEEIVGLDYNTDTPTIICEDVYIK